MDWAQDLRHPVVIGTQAAASLLKGETSSSSHSRNHLRCDLLCLPCPRSLANLRLILPLRPGSQGRMATSWMSSGSCMLPTVTDLTFFLLVHSLILDILQLLRYH